MEQHERATMSDHTINEALLVPALHPGRSAAYMREHEILVPGPVVYRDGKDVLHRGVAVVPCMEPFEDCAAVFNRRTRESHMVPRSGLYLDMAHRPSLDHVLYRATVKRLTDMGQMREGCTLESASMVARFNERAEEAWLKAVMSIWYPARDGHKSFRITREMHAVWGGSIKCETPYTIPDGGSLLQALAVVKFANEVFSVEPEVSHG